MYKLTCGKCVVCFLFLVMVAFLSCSGFRIDSDRLGAMGGFSDSTTGVSVASAPFTAGAVAGAKPRRTTTRHRLRHAKHYRVSPQPTSWIDVFVRAPTAPSAPSDAGQIPQPGVVVPPHPTEPLTKRSQRSPAKHHQNQHQQHHPQQHARSNKKARPCQEQDTARKAYMANTVVLAKAESRSTSRVRNYNVSFRILRRFKYPEYAVVDDNLRLSFLNDTRRMHCESELGGGEGGVVKALIRPPKEYYLFLNSHGNHNYSVVGAPVENRRKLAKDIERILLSVTRKNFAPNLRKPEITRLEKERGKVRLDCKVRGYPIPVIEWKKNETVLQSSPNLKITYKGEDLIDRKRSFLVIRSIEEKDSGRYTCVAHGVDGQVQETSYELRIANKEKCDNNLYCLNGGTCKNERSLKEPYCICSEGYKGERCDQKTILEPQPSFMYEDD